MGIGPELPPHLAEAPAGPSSAPSAGPQLPPAVAAAGPQLPPGLAPAAASAADEDSDDDYVPDLPPDLLHARKAGPTAPVAGPSAPSKAAVLGPTLPPGFPARSPAAVAPLPPQKRETPLSNYYSDDDDFGPMPLPAGHKVEEESEGARLFREREEREKEKLRKEQEGKGKLVREEWMLVPPKEMDLLSTMDPTKLKSRTFQNSAQLSSAASKKGSSTGPNLWTETPQERKQRLEDEMMGRKRKAEVSASGGGIVEEETDEQRRKRLRDAQLRDEVERHNAASRSASLLDQHSSSNKRTKKDGEKEVPGIWDRERDMSVGGRLMDDNKKADVIRNAKELGGRFGGGSFL